MTLSQEQPDYYHYDGDLEDPLSQPEPGVVEWDHKRLNYFLPVTIPAFIITLIIEF
jgi:hypothetical protein